jgi:hypothetical protein
MRVVPPQTPGRRARRALWISGSLVALGSFAFSLPASLARWPITDDAIEYVGIAYNWVSGRGFVDPVMWSYFLPDAVPPLPGLAVRAPLLPLLLAIPVRLGASLETLGLLHVAWSALVAGGMVLVARRMMSLPAAVGCAVAITASTGWFVASQTLVSEATAVAMLLAMVASARCALRPGPGPFLCAALATLAWLARPNLAVFVPALLVAAALELGPAAALRSRALWSYAIGAVVLQQSVRVACQALTGFAPYAHYALAFEVFEFSDFPRYESPYTGPLAFVWLHAGEVASRVGRNLVLAADLLFAAPYYNLAGWLAVPGLLHALRGRSDGAFEPRLCAVAAGAMALPTLGFYGPTNLERYLLPAVVLLWLVNLGFLDAAARGLRAGLERRRAPASAPRAPAARRLVSPFGPLLLVGALVSGAGAREIASVTATLWTHYRQQGTLRVFRSWDETARRFCPSVERDAVVAAGPSPWAFYLWCGNASMWTPNDLRSLGSLGRYLDERSPAYLVASAREGRRLMDRSPRLERVATHGPWVLYRVREPGPRSRWNAPPPLHRLGAEPLAPRPVAP